MDICGVEGAQVELKYPKVNTVVMRVDIMQKLLQSYPPKSEQTEPEDQESELIFVGVTKRELTSSI